MKHHINIIYLIGFLIVCIFTPIVIFSITEQNSNNAFFLIFQHNLWFLVFYVGIAYATFPFFQKEKTPLRKSILTFLYYGWFTIIVSFVVLLFYASDLVNRNIALENETNLEIKLESNDVEKALLEDNWKEVVITENSVNDTKNITYLYKIMPTIKDEFGPNTTCTLENYKKIPNKEKPLENTCLYEIE